MNIPKISVEFAGFKLEYTDNEILNFFGITLEYVYEFNVDNVREDDVFLSGEIALYD